MPSFGLVVIYVLANMERLEKGGGSLSFESDADA
jgi:hypothetical protein